MGNRWDDTTQHQFYPATGFYTISDQYLEVGSVVLLSYGIGISWVEKTILYCDSHSSLSSLSLR